MYINFQQMTSFGSHGDCLELVHVKDAELSRWWTKNCIK